MFDMFLFFVLLIIFTAHTMAWILSFCCKQPEGTEGYVNPYRIIPREESEIYKRYERQLYLDSLRG
jgi:hypothetical protein